jgi:hypothetical protein
MLAIILMIRGLPVSAGVRQLVLRTGSPDGVEVQLSANAPSGHVGRHFWSEAFAQPEADPVQLLRLIPGRQSLHGCPDLRQVLAERSANISVNRRRRSRLSSTRIRQHLAVRVMGQRHVLAEQAGGLPRLRRNLGVVVFGVIG